MFGGGLEISCLGRLTRGAWFFFGFVRVIFGSGRLRVPRSAATKLFAGSLGLALLLVGLGVFGGLWLAVGWAWGWGWALGLLLTLGWARAEWSAEWASELARAWPLLSVHRPILLLCCFPLCSLAVRAPALASTPRDALRAPILSGPLTLRRGAPRAGALAGLVLARAWPAWVEAPTEAPLVGGVATAFDWHSPGTSHVSCLGAFGCLHNIELHNLTISYTAQELPWVIFLDCCLVDKDILFGVVSETEEIQVRV